jgi:hypothetical protein
MKPFKKFISEAFDLRPESESDIRNDKNIPKDWQDFVVDIWKDKALKGNLVFQATGKLNKHGEISGSALAGKIKPGRFAEIKMGKVKIGSKFKVDGLDKGAKTIKLSRDYKWKGETYTYSISLVSGLGSKAGKSPTGAQWESMITAAYNGGYKTGSDTFKEVEKFWDNYGVIAMEIGDWCKKNKVKGAMTQFGATSGSLTKDWKTWGGSNKTPKTDMYTPKQNISLKKAGGSQLMSARGAETYATFHGAMAHYGSTPRGGKALADLIMDEKEGFPKMVLNSTIDELKAGTGQAAASYTPAELQKKQKEYKAKDKLMHGLSEKISKFFNKNKEFQEYFVYEASSGYAKFGVGSQSVANQIMVFDADEGTNNLFKPLGDDPTQISSYIKGYAGRTTFYVSFKSSGKNPAGVLRSKTAKKVVAKKESIDYDYLDVLRETIQEDEYASQFLNEETEQLDEFAILKKVWDTTVKSVKSTGKSVGRVAKHYADQMKKGYAWLDKFFKNYIAKIKSVVDNIVKMGAKALETMLKFFGIMPDQVQFSEPGF